MIVEIVLDIFETGVHLLIYFCYSLHNLTTETSDDSEFLSVFVTFLSFKYLATELDKYLK